MNNRRLDREQAKAIKAITKALRKSGRALVQMATGTGKTRTYVKYLKANPKLRVLVLTHMNELVGQHVGTLKAAGLDVGEFSSSVRDTGSQIIVASIPTLSRANHFDTFGKKRFDLIVVDEAHHAPAETWKKLIERFKAKRLGLTATPYRPDGRRLDGLFGEVAHALDFKTAQKQRLIAQHDAWVVLTNSVLHGLVSVGGDYTQSVLDKLYASGDRDQTIVSAYKKYGRGGMTKAGLKHKTVCFCINTAHAQRLAKVFAEAGVKSDFLVGNTELQSSTSRAKIFEAFKTSNAIEVLCVVGIFNEGVDVPDIACALMARPTRSNIIYQQQIGRAARLLQGKKTTFVLLDFVDNTRREFGAYTVSNLTSASPLKNRIIAEYLNESDPVVVEKRVGDVMSGVDRFEDKARCPRGGWTKDACLREAKKFKTRSKFRKGAGGAYTAADVNSWMTEICAHMPPANKPKGFWTKEKCAKLAKLYDLKKHFEVGHPKAYNAAYCGGFLNEICVHMSHPKRRTEWTDEDLILQALKYETRVDLKRGNFRAYSAIINRGLTDRAFNHMKNCGRRVKS